MRTVGEGQWRVGRACRPFRFGWARLGSIGLDWARLGSIGLDCVQLCDEECRDLSGDGLEDERSNQRQRLREEAAHAVGAQEVAGDARPRVNVRSSPREHVEVVRERLETA